MQKYKVLFLGLGRMGFHMSAHLSKSKNVELFNIFVISKKFLSFIVIFHLILTFLELLCQIF